MSGPNPGARAVEPDLGLRGTAMAGRSATASGAAIAGRDAAAGPDKAGPDEAGPDEAGPDEAGPDKAGPDEANRPEREDSRASHTLPLWIPVALFAFALFLRLTFLATHTQPLQSDEIDYEKLGWTLASTGHYTADGAPTAYRPAGYPAFIAALYAFTGRDPQAIKTAQAVLDSITAVLIFLIFSRRNRTAGLLAGTIWAALPTAILFSTQLFSETLLTFGLALFFYASDRLTRSPRFAWALGLLLGCLIFVRPFVTGFFAAGAPFAIEQKSIRRRAIILALVLLPPGLWIARNALVLHAPVFTTSVGVNLFIGNHEGATGSYAPVDPSLAPRAEPNQPMTRPRSHEVAQDAAAGRAAFQSIIQDPGAAVARAAKKVLFLFTSEGELAVGHFAPSSANQAARYRERYRSVPVWIHLLISLPMACLLILGTLGLAVRTPDLIERLFYTLLFATLLSCVLFFGGSRFRFPLLVPLSGFAAEFLADPRIRRSRTSRKRVALAALAIGTLLAVWAAEISFMSSGA